MGEVDSGRGCACWGGGRGYVRSLCTRLNFAVNLKLLLQIKPIFFLKGSLQKSQYLLRSNWRSTVVCLLSLFSFSLDEVFSSSHIPSSE